jgi:pimeloyl-ACP methyl ester carboxylesterase
VSRRRSLGGVAGGRRGLRQDAGLTCSQVEVPLDRAGRVGGSVSLHVEVLPPAGRPHGVVFLLAGGPGQPSAEVFGLGSSSSAGYYRFLFPDYTLVAFDPRGSGGSGPLSCPDDSRDSGPLFGAACAAALGPQRDFYGTGDQAEDIDAVRQALGVDRIALWGTSYGTKVAVAYALAHPDHVERMLLDSVLPPDLPRTFGGNVARMLPQALADYCGDGGCRAATGDFAGDVVGLANELVRTPAVGKVLQPDGSRS